MTEEVVVPEGQEDEVQTPEYTPIQLRAMEMGWRPPEEFNGAEDDFIDAQEFVNRKPLFDKIETQSKQIKNVTKALEALKTHYTKVQETEFNRALATLKAQRKTALHEGDGDSFERLDDEIRDVEKQLDVVKASQDLPLVPQEPTEHPEFVNWKAKNPWYGDTRYMREYADEVGVRLAATGVPPSEVLKQVEVAVRKEFPHKFRNQNKESAPDVSTSRTGTRGSSKGESIELNDQERRIMNTLVSQGVLTKEKYIADLKAAKERG